MSALIRVLASFLIAVWALHSLSLGAQGDDPLRAALATRVNEAKQGTGVVVGLLTPEGRSFASYGHISLDGPAPGPDTVAEIGSLGKLFTAFSAGQRARPFHHGPAASWPPLARLNPRRPTC